MRSFNDILGDLNTGMDGMTSAEKQNIIASIFNKTDLAAVNSLLANTGDTWDSLQQSITESGGAAQQMADTQLDNLSGQITILKSALEGLAISFGELLMPKIRAAAEKVQSFVDKLNGMKEFWNTIQIVFATVGGWLGWFLGGCDGLLYALLAFVVVDYVTGIMCAVVDKKLSSTVGFKGIFKKVLIFTLVGIANIVDVQVLGTPGVLRTAVNFFYLSNEGVSMLENAANLGLPVPDTFPAG